MSEQVTLPPGLSSSATLEEIRSYLQTIDTWLRAREPQAVGGSLEKFLTAEAAVSAGLLTYSPGLGGMSGSVGTSGNTLLPGNSTLNPADPSQPTAATGLTVTSIVSGFFIEIDAPTYRQGGGNGRTIIYRANYSGSGPLPTFANAVEVGYMSGRSTILVLDAEPGVQGHFWAKSETRHPTLQVSPTGGTNGVSATAGQISNDHISDLSVSKLTAGTLSVGEYIQSTGYDAGVEGFRLNGDGTGQLAGLTIGADYIQSANFVTLTSGWHINNDGTAEFDAATIRGTLTTDQIQIGAVSSGTESINNSATLDIHADGYAYNSTPVSLGDVVRDTGTSTLLVICNGELTLEADAAITSGDYYVALVCRLLINSSASPTYSVQYPKAPVDPADQIRIPFAFSYTADSTSVPAGTRTMEFEVQYLGFKDAGFAWVDPGADSGSTINQIRVQVIELKV